MAEKPRRRPPKSPIPRAIPPSALEGALQSPAPAPPAPTKSRWEGLSDEKKLEMALRHFGIKKAEVLSYRVYPHKVAIVYGYGQKVTYWPEG